MPAAAPIIPRGTLSNDLASPLVVRKAADNALARGTAVIKIQHVYIVVGSCDIYLGSAKMGGCL